MSFKSKTCVKGQRKINLREYNPTGVTIGLKLESKTFEIVTEWLVVTTSVLVLCCKICNTAKVGQFEPTSGSFD